MPQGYRVVSFDLSSLEAKTLQFRNPVDLTIGSSHTSPGGFFLGSDEGFLEHYLGGTDDKDLILTFNYDEADLLTEVSPNSELKVKKATLVDLRFHDEALQQKFGHVLNSDEIARRRQASPGVCVKDVEQGREFTVIRAMSIEVNHLFPMDYVFKTLQGVMPGSAKRVLKAYEQGFAHTSHVEMRLRAALDHAVTTALYEGAPQRVTFARVKAEQIFKASNEGEYFFDAPKALLVQTAFEVDAEGRVSIPAPEPKREAERESPTP